MSSRNRWHASCCQKSGPIFPTWEIPAHVVTPSPFACRRETVPVGLRESYHMWCPSGQSNIQRFSALETTPYHNELMRRSARRDLHHSRRAYECCGVIGKCDTCLPCDTQSIVTCKRCTVRNEHSSLLSSVSRVAETLSAQASQNRRAIDCSSNTFSCPLISFCCPF